MTARPMPMVILHRMLIQKTRLSLTAIPLAMRKPTSDSDDITINILRHALVDEENHILTITADEKNADLCVKDGDAYTWKPMGNNG